MQLKKLSLSLCLALAAPSMAADAADWNKGSSIKDYRAGVPVPAPVPVADTFKWYLRADVGGGLYTGGDPAFDGNMYGFDRDPAEGPAFGIQSSWFGNSFDTFAVGGVGVGAYLTPRIRADVTVDARTPTKLGSQGNYSYTGDPDIYNPGGGGFIARINGTTTEHIEVRGLMSLANVYFDLAERGSRFVPYVGGGVGFVVRSIQRTHNTLETVENLSTAPITVADQYSFSGKSKAHQVAPAAALMAGFGYTLDSGMVLDFNYRFAYIGEVENRTTIDTSGSRSGIDAVSNKLSLGDLQEHAIRAGVRWNVW